jgi:riboflavin-specific deaminase-like protein
MKRRGLPFVFINAAISADGKLAPASRRFEPFGGRRDHDHLLELRATADAVMAGARTVDLDRVNMGPGPAKYRRARLKRGLAEYNLRIIVSGSGTINPKAEIFRHRFSPIIILTSERAAKQKLLCLKGLADEVKVCGKTSVDFEEALRWLRANWKVERLACEGGGEVNGAMFEADLVDEVHLTLCPLIFGGRDAPTLADSAGIQHLSQTARLRLASMRRYEGGLFLVYRRS